MFRYSKHISIVNISILMLYRLNCVTISDSGIIMACGFADSTIKVFILNAQSHTIITAKDLVTNEESHNESSNKKSSITN
jgi:hypothetical protein